MVDFLFSHKRCHIIYIYICTYCICIHILGIAIYPIFVNLKPYQNFAVGHRHKYLEFTDKFELKFLPQTKSLNARSSRGDSYQKDAENHWLVVWNHGIL